MSDAESPADEVLICEICGYQWDWYERDGRWSIQSCPICESDMVHVYRDGDGGIQKPWW